MHCTSYTARRSPDALAPGILEESLPLPLPLVAAPFFGSAAGFFAVALPPFLPPSDCAALPAAVLLPDLPVRGIK